MAELFLRAAMVLVGLAVLGGVALLWVRAQSVDRGRTPSVVAVPRLPGLEGRRERRVPVRLLASWEGLDGPLSTVDISRAGCCLRGNPLPAGEGTLTLWMPGALPRWRRPAIVRWRADGNGAGDPMCGLAFLDDGEAPADAWDALFREQAAPSTAARQIVIAVADGRPSTAAIVNEAVEAGRQASAIGQLHERLGELLGEGNTPAVRDTLRRTLAILEAQAATALEARIVDVAGDGVLDAVLDDLLNADVILCDAADVVTLERLRAQRGDEERPLLVGVGAPAQPLAKIDFLLADDRDVRELLATVRTLARSPSYGVRASAGAPPASPALGAPPAA